MNSGEYRAAIDALPSGKRLPGAVYLIDPGDDPRISDESGRPRQRFFNREWTRMNANEDGNWTPPPCVDHEGSWIGDRSSKITTPTGMRVKLRVNPRSGGLRSADAHDVPMSESEALCIGFPWTGRIGVSPLPILHMQTVSP